MSTKIDLREFVEFGYLQEVNRLLLHPLGLEMVITDHGYGLSIDGVEDGRDEVGGLIYGKVDLDKARRVQEALESAFLERKTTHGFWIQPMTFEGT